MVSLLNKNSKLLVIKILIIKIIKILLTIKAIVVITIITMIIISRGRCRMPTTTNKRAPCDITEWPKAFK